VPRIKVIARAAGAVALVVFGVFVLTGADRAASAALSARSEPASAAAARRVQAGELLVAAESGRLLVLDPAGHTLWRVPGSVGTPLHSVQAVELSPDRRGAFVSVYSGGEDARLYLVDLTTGNKRPIANAVTPTLSPDRRTLAYISITTSRSDLVFENALVVRNLRTSRTRSIPLPAGLAVGTPPAFVINWSPDGRRIAIFDGRHIRFVDVARAREVESQPALPGKGEPVRVDGMSVGRAALETPVYVGAHSVVVLANCCVGQQHLIEIDLRSGARTHFATLPAPDEQIRRLHAATLLVVTAAAELATVSHGRVHALASGITAAAP
jgi:hypothetical protein